MKDAKALAELQKRFAMELYAVHPEGAEGQWYEEPESLRRLFLNAAAKVMQTPTFAAALDQPWQPIETAPRDGSPILAFNGRLGIHMIAKWTNYMHGVSGWNCGNDLTHWMPLPLAPAPQQEGE